MDIFESGQGISEVHLKGTFYVSPGDTMKNQVLPLDVGATICASRSSSVNIYRPGPHSPHKNIFFCLLQSLRSTLATPASA